MTPLLPDLERQLRRAVRDRQAEQSAKRPARPKRRAMALVAAAAAIAIGAVIVLSAGIGAGPSLSEAQALERAANAAERGLAAPTLAPGEYWYVRSVTAGTTGYRALGSPALIQSRQTTEIWQSTDGSGRERSVNDGLPLFFGTPVARAHFRREEARAPKPVPVDELLPHSTGFRSPLGILTYGQVQALPSTPDAMLHAIRHAAEHFLSELRLQAPGSPVAEESLAQTELESISGILADLPLSPQQRAATYRMTEKLPGVIYIPHVTDALGRTGAALASNGLHYRFIDGSGELSKPASVREELIFDPSTGVLLAQQRALLSSIPSVGLPAGYAGAVHRICELGRGREHHGTLREARPHRSRGARGPHAGLHKRRPSPYTARRRSHPGSPRQPVRRPAPPADQRRAPPRQRVDLRNPGNTRSHARP